MINDVVSGLHGVIHHDDRIASKPTDYNRWFRHLAYATVRINEDAAPHVTCLCKIKAKARQGRELGMAQDCAMDVCRAERCIFEITGCHVGIIEAGVV